MARLPRSGERGYGVWRIHVLAALGLEDLIPLAVFGACVAAIWFVLSLLSQRNDRALGRLKRLFRSGSADAEGEDLEKKDRFQGMVETAKAFAAPLMPKSEHEQSTLRLKLSYAGFRSDSAAA